jgi:glycosyltransferase involved in cell wall biosynthesis
MQDKIKIAWITPSTEKTSITEFSTSVLKKLLNYFDIDVYSFDGSWKKEFDSIDTRKITLTKIEDFDAKNYLHVIYNLGNNWENHGNIIELASENPGIVILHDASMHHVIAYYTNEILRDRGAYANLMVAAYNTKAKDEILKSDIQAETPIYAPWDSNVGPDFGFLDFFTSNHYGLITHSKYTSSKLLNIEEYQNVHLTRLPGDEKGSWNENEISTWRAKFKVKKEIVFCIMGYLNLAKNIEIAIETIALLNKDNFPCRLLILGADKNKYNEDLFKLAKSFSIEKNVEFQLNLDREEFNIQKSRVDLHLSIRYPNYEGCSAAAYEAMLTGRPLVSYTAGAYAEIPNDSVIYFESLNPYEIKQSIINTCYDKEKLIEIGANGRNYSKSMTSEKYALDLSEYLKSLNSNISTNKLSGLQTHKIDGMFSNPNYIFFDENALNNVDILLSVEPLKTIFSSSISKALLKELYGNNKELFWDTIGFIKLYKLGKFEKFQAKPINLNNKYLQLITTLLKNLNDKNIFESFKKINISITEKR